MIFGLVLSLIDFHGTKYFDIDEYYKEILTILYHTFALCQSRLEIGILNIIKNNARLITYNIVFYVNKLI